MIEVEDLWRTFGKSSALRGTSFRVESGSVAGFLGPNGAGKSTTMRILTTFLPPTRGTARVDGFDVVENPGAVCARVGYLPESMPIHPELRVTEYLRYRCALKGIRSRDAKSRIASVIDECGLESVRCKLLGALSRGFRQRLGLADALLGDPPVLILDEPTSGLDPRQVTEVRRLIAGFRGLRTVLLSSHILGEVEQVCDQVIIIAEGTVREEISREEWSRRVVGAKRLRLVLAEPPSHVEKHLRTIPGVQSVKIQDGGFAIRADRDVRLEVSSLAAAHHWKLLELQPRPASLESLFLQVTGDRPNGGR